MPWSRPDVTVCVATFGSDAWFTAALEIAIPSAQRLGCPVVHKHASTLHAARNAALEEVTTKFVIFLDADDQLDPAYLESMGKMASVHSGVHDDLVCVPLVQHCRKEGNTEPVYPKVAGHTHRCKPACLIYGNYIVIGAMMTTDLVRKVGGFRDFGWEDWDLFVRCFKEGAHFLPSRAIYRVNVRAGSRGGYSAAESLRHHIAVAKANGLPIPSTSSRQS